MLVGEIRHDSGGFGAELGNDLGNSPNPEFGSPKSKVDLKFAVLRPRKFSGLYDGDLLLSRSASGRRCRGPERGPADDAYGPISEELFRLRLVDSETLTRRQISCITRCNTLKLRQVVYGISFDIEARKENSAAPRAHSKPEADFHIRSDTASDRGMGGTAGTDRSAL